MKKVETGSGLYVNLNTEVSSWIGRRLIRRAVKAGRWSGSIKKDGRIYLDEVDFTKPELFIIFTALLIKTDRSEIGDY